MPLLLERKNFGVRKTRKQPLKKHALLNSLKCVELGGAGHNLAGRPSVPGKKGSTS